MRNLPSFDEVHCISDLHLGGREGFQIFGSTKELEGLIRQLAARAASARVALVINGDFIDFLAEVPSVHFDPEGATDKITRIVQDKAFAPVFDALSAFVAQAGRTLVINLGNHDLELALPWVRAHLIELVARGDDAARGRIHTVMDGSGFACVVGAASVMCVHGNEVDSWNVADFDRIRRIGRDSQFGQRVDAWVPNAGTKLVIDVMNDIKKRYPFVDLLKPEAQGVVPILAALDPDAKPKLREVTGVLERLTLDAIRGRMGFLGDALPGEGVGRPGTDEATQGPGAATMAEVHGQPAPRTAQALMAFVEQEARLETDPMSLVQDQSAEQLGLWDAIKAVVKGESKAETLRQALDGLDKDRSFDTNASDDTFKSLDERMSSGLDFVIAGHTHLERALKRRNGQGFYFNSGTWARLIQIKPEVRQSEARFTRLIQLFDGGTMDKLDAEPGLVIKRCSVVSIWKDGKRTRGEIRRVRIDGKTVRLEPQPGTQFTKEA